MLHAAEESETAQLAALRRGDERAFAVLVERHQGVLLRLARSWVKDPALADDVLQKTWLVALESLGSFEGRSTLRTWLCGIVINVARAHLRSSYRDVPLSSLVADEIEGAHRSVDAEHFIDRGHRWEGHWLAPPSPFPSPDVALERSEVRASLEEAIAGLPPVQQQILVLCDIEGMTGEEVCNILALTGTHQRVLLHRARTRLRKVLEGIFSSDGVAVAAAPEAGHDD